MNIEELKLNTHVILHDKSLDYCHGTGEGVARTWWINEGEWLVSIPGHHGGLVLNYQEFDIDEKFHYKPDGIYQSTKCLCGENYKWHFTNIEGYPGFHAEPCSLGRRGRSKWGARSWYTPTD